MPDLNITLDLRNSSVSTDGWIPVTAENGQVYSYKYAGGNNGPGGVNVNTANQRIVVDLVADRRYKVHAVGLTDPKGDVSKSHTDYQVVLTDSDADKDYDIYYSITVKDTSADTTFEADPEIHNEGAG